jgi:hypothetical protein
MNILLTSWEKRMIDKKAAATPTQIEKAKLTSEVRP